MVEGGEGETRRSRLAGQQQQQQNRSVDHHSPAHLPPQAVEDAALEQAGGRHARALQQVFAHEVVHRLRRLRDLARQVPAAQAKGAGGRGMSTVNSA